VLFYIVDSRQTGVLRRTCTDRKVSATYDTPCLKFHSL